MESASGIVALAVVLLWLGYYVPHRVQHRQQLLEARTEDRFSGALRVLSVAGRGLGTPERLVPTLDGTLAVAAAPTGGGRALLGSAPGATQRTTGTEGTAGTTSTTSTARSDRSDGRTHDEVEDAMEISGSASSPRGAVPDVGRPSTSRLALLERRAAAARRRLALTVVLLLASVAVWVVVGLGLVAWWAGVVPTALLALVLVLGRRAVLSAQRADAAWLAERRAEARAARGTVAGSPAAPRNVRPRVTGRAVHGSQLSTQMIPRVTAKDLARAGATAAADSAAATVATPGGSGRGTSRAGSSTPRTDDDPAEGSSARPEKRDEVPTTVVAGTAETTEQTEDRVPSGRAWDPVPVPRPTYTMKPTAPRREPAPLAEDETSPAAVRPAAAGTAAAVPMPERTAAPERAEGDAQKPSTETLGLALDEILARRRAAGQ
ncbi:hypothetical protein [Cellulosimicrobium sp. Marseille-Q4280]|uniref:hypothetical protein n=1 Tax=Cellulosimicrobium sp. Marseille-Q4280 TaxID=2937992 RepID=UPI00203FFEB1|nr:hypothetical protein [Cellulosimicrobium sp. Marseille-Q4280]